MSFSDAIKYLMYVFRLSKWDAESDGSYIVFIDETREINIKKDLSNLLFYGFFGENTPENDESFIERFKIVLQWNFWHVKSNDDVIGFSREKNKMVVCKRLPLQNLTEESLSLSIDNFIKNVDFWYDVYSKKSAQKWANTFPGLYVR